MKLDRNSWIRLIFSLAAIGLCSIALSAEGDVSFDRQDDRLLIRIDGQPFATYVWRDEKIRRPYLAQVRVPGGRQVTRNHPPIEGKDAIDHAEMHPGIWLAFGDLSGSDFWRNKAEVRHIEFVEPPRADGPRGALTVRNRYLSGDNVVCEELCRIGVQARPGGFLIDWDSRFSAAAEFHFGDQEEMGLGVRVATPLTVKAGGTITNSHGRKNEREVWGQTAPWCDYSGTIDGQAAGLLLMPDPANFRPSWFHARDYGVLVANPFGRKAFTGGESSRVVVKPGESLRLRFGILAHAGETDLAGAYAEWVAAIEDN